MLEVRENQKGNKQQLFFEDKLIAEAFVWIESNSKDKYNIALPFNNICKDILDNPINLLNIKKLRILNILDRIEKEYFEDFVDIFVNRREEILTLDLNFFLQGRPFDWDLPFSLNVYAEKFINLWVRKYEFYADAETVAEPYDLAVTINFSFEDISEPIFNEIFDAKTAIEDCHQQTFELLQDKSRKLYIATFNFPESLKIPCEQYLLYFAQFLQDLGINATSNLKEEAGKVLFSVKPNDETQALDKIREALAVYLNLPSSPIVYDDSFKSMRMQQQIENLQHSQRMKARELQFSEKLLAAQSDMIREKNVTISQLQTVNEQQQKIIEKISSKSIMMDSVENKEELEEVYDGIKVGESESLKKWLGISLNPAKAIKTAVKNTFGKEDGKKSVLGLDEES